MPRTPTTPPGVDLASGMSEATLLWTLKALARERPASVGEDFMLWLNAISGVAELFLAAGGKRSELSQFETDGLTFGPAL